MPKYSFRSILLFSILLVLLVSVRGYAEPTYSNPVNYTPSNYNFSTYTVFNVTWSNSTNTTTVDTSQVQIEINYTETPENYSMDLISGDEYEGIYGFQEILGAGTYEWRSCAKDNETQESCTDYYQFTINPASPTLHVEINGNDTNKILVYSLESNVTAWEDNNDANCVYGLYRNDIEFPSFSEINTLGVGVYDYIYNVTNCTNYTDSSLTRTLTITQGTLPFHLYLDDIENNRTDGDSYELYEIANFTAFLNTGGISYELEDKTIYLESDYPFSVNSNNSTLFNYTINLTSPGLFNLFAYWNGDENYSYVNETYYFGVEPYCINNSESPISGSTYSSGKNYSFQIKCIGDIQDVIFEWNGANYTANNSNDIFYYNLTDLPAGTHSYQWHVIDTSNNTFSTDQYPYIINQIPVALSWLYPSSTWTFDTGTSVTVQCQSDTLVNLTLNVGSTTVYSSPSSPGFVSYSPSSSTATTYACSCHPTSSNYSGYISKALYFQDPISSPPSSPDGGDTPSSGSFLITGLTSSLTIDAGKSKSTTFKLKNTLANNVENITISLLGINSNWYTVSKVNRVLHGMNETVTLTFNIPENAEAKEYSVTVTARGKPLSGTSRTATQTMKLIVTASQSEEAPQVELQEASVEEEVFAEENVTINSTSNETTIGPTGLAATFEYLKNNIVMVVGVAACLLIFIFRNNITTGFMRAGGRKVPEKKKQKESRKVKIKLPSLGKYKLAINLKRGIGRKTKTIEEPKEPKRPEVLEREIKRDIKELQQVLEAEKKLEKKNKKTNLDNN